MKITAPASSPGEVEMLLHHGADELYCGMNARQWEESLGGRWWMNRRSPRKANLASWEDLGTVVKMAHEKETPVHITLNTPFYPGEGLDLMVALSEKLVARLSVDSLIVSDVNLLARLQKERLPVKIHLSSLGSCFNSQSVEFYKSLGVERIILPRQLRLSEIRRLAADAGAGMEFEVFAVNDGCVFEEGFCQTSHALGPFCLTDWEAVSLGPDGGRIPPEQLQEGLAEFREFRWYQNNCGSSHQQDGLPNGPCALCWFGHFRDWGVASVKIVGREASFYRKMRSLQMVKAVMDQANRGADHESIGRFARSMRNTPDYCRKGWMCYFRDETDT
ncbi:MAG: U32 family peptidase [Desulfobacterales bacterium]|nr:U32 family peptidase [Desulfobacterales bacterium]